MKKGKRSSKLMLQKYLFPCRIVEENAYLCIRNHETLSIEIKKPLWSHNQSNLVRSACCKMFSRPLQRWAADAACVFPARRKLESNMISPRFHATFPLFSWHLLLNSVTMIKSRGGSASFWSWVIEKSFTFSSAKTKSARFWRRF